MVLLHAHPLSSHAQKVKIALREKGVAFRSQTPEDFGTATRGTPFPDARPRGEVRAPVQGDLALFDSTVILEYIEKRWPEFVLLPPDPAGAPGRG